VQVNNRTVAAIVLDGKGRNRVVQVPLSGAKPKDGYLKLAFLYSGAVTPDHCIDVRYVGDSLIIRPETAVEVDVGPTGRLDVPTTAALMPRDVGVFLPSRHLAATELATALTVGRALITSGRRVTFYNGYDAVTELAQRDEAGRWAHGIVLVGTLADVGGIIDSPIASVAGDIHQFGMIDAVRVRGLPALVIADADSVRAARLFGTPMLAAMRGVASASVGQMAPIDLPKDRVTFDQLGVPPEEVEVFGRAELTTVIDARHLPGGTYPTRLSLDLMVAPDGVGAKAVASVFVNDRLLGSTVVATTEATHLDLPLPDGLIGTAANIRVVVERDIAQGDCRFGPQGYPAQILGSSALLLGSTGEATTLKPSNRRSVDGSECASSAANVPMKSVAAIADRSHCRMHQALWSASKWLRTVKASVIGSKGFEITPWAPSAMNCSTSRGWARAVMNKIGTAEVRGFLRKCDRVVGPSMRGIITSSRINDGDHSVTAASASSPDAHERTWKSGLRPSDKSTISRISGSSST
jgi:hypothetical protein